MINVKIMFSKDPGLRKTEESLSKSEAKPSPFVRTLKWNGNILRMWSWRKTWRKWSRKKVGKCGC
jgi:hypothetical protein